MDLTHLNVMEIIVLGVVMLIAFLAAFKSNR